MLIALGLCLFAIMGWAQSNTGRLIGNVSSPDGVVTSATVFVTDKQTNRERKVVTNSEGLFSIPQIDVGIYTIKVEAAGFKSYVVNEVKIDVGQEYSLNINLEVGRIEDSVTVTAGSDLVNSTSAELSNTVSPRMVKELPLNGRNPLALITLQAGTSSNGTTTSINGQRSSFTNITRDGINIQDNFIRANAVDFVPDRPNVDGTGEFTIVTQNAGAEVGYGSSQVQTMTSRGGSQFHGAGFLYNRNSEFAANSFFRNSSNTPKPFLNRNQFGGSFSGPLPLPTFGKGGSFFARDKAFFFVAYEGFRQRQSTLPNRTILLSDARQGNFTYRDSTGATQTVNVLTLAGLTGVDPLIQSRILNNTPTVGNNTDTGDQLNTTGFRFNQLQNQDREAVDTRLDFQINERQSINAVYGYRTEFLLRPDADDGGFNTTPFGFQSTNTHLLVVAHRLSGARFSNEIRSGFQVSNPKFDRTGQPTDFFITIPLITSPESTFQAQGRKTGIYNIQNNAVYSWGAHQLRFGGQTQFFRIQPFGPPAFAQSTIPTVAVGTSTATPTLTAPLFPGGISPTQLANANSLLALLGGFIGNVSQTFNATSKTSGYVPGAASVRNLNYENFSFYGSDQWRIRQNLTFNLGLRYEIFNALREPNGLALEPVIPAGKSVRDAILDPNGTYNFIGTNLGDNKFFNTDYNNFSPIVSFSWSPRFNNRIGRALFPGDGRAVIRGGYRMSYVNDEYVRAADNALSGNQGLTSTVALPNLNSRFGAVPTISAPPFIIPRTYSQNNAITNSFGTVFAIDPNLQIPRVEEYNLSIQREIGFETALEIRYVGGRSNNLVRGIDLNQIDIFNNGFLADFNRARQNLVLATAANATNPAIPISGAFNSAVAGSQMLTVFPNLVGGGVLGNALVRNNLNAGVPADLALLYIQNGLTGTVPFLANPNTGVVDLINNSALSRYNSLQAEIRRRLSKGFYFQANYTFQKTLTNALGIGQTRFEPLLDNNNPRLEYQRADFDSTHVFNFNSIYELPFGRGRKYLDRGGVMDLLLGGWQFGSIARVSSGAPITIIDPRGTFNRAGRSGRQTPFTTLTNDQVKDLVNVRKLGNGVFFIDPSVINVNADGSVGGTKTGRGSEGFGQTPFTGQAFFSVAPGDYGTLNRALFDGPLYFNMDASLLKNFRLKENMKFQFRGEAFNIINRSNFFIGNTLNINSTNFGRITQTFDPRIVQFVGRLEF
jgi:Carboxypeptidase regulatory-like domain